MPPNLRLAAIGAAVVVLIGAVVAVVLNLPGSGPANAPLPPAPPLFVDPAGVDTNDGSQGAPLQSIQAALDKATPGTTINLAPGVYRGQVATTRDGTPEAPITIKGPETGKDRSGRYRAVVTGPDRVINIDHRNIVLEGFTVDGQEKLLDTSTPYPTDLGTIDAFKTRVQPQVEDTRLIYLGSADDTRDVSGVTIRNMFLSGAGGECVRLRNNAHDNTITDSVIQYCGMFGKNGSKNRAEFHNGEGVYIGTSPKSDTQPMHENDTSSRNIVRNNLVRTFGSECFDVKENAHENVFEGNTCSDNAESVDFEGSLLELRGGANVVRGNVLSDSAGYGVKIQSDGEEYDLAGNTVENNRIGATAAEPFKIKTDAQLGQICGNALNTGGKHVTGDGYDGDPTTPCSTGGSAPGPS